MQIVDILGQLVPNIWTALSQLCATAVLFFLMYKLAWKPVKKILDTRSEFEQAKLDEAQKLQEENEKVNHQAQEIIADANKTAETIVRSAQKEGQETAQEIIAEANQQAAKIIEDANKQARTQHDKVMKDMHGEIVDVAIAAAEKMLQEKIDDKTDINDIESFIREIVQK